MTDAERMDELRAKLASILAEYNATIGVDIEGDTHSLIVHMEISMPSIEDYPGRRRGKDYTLRIESGYIDPSNL